MSRSRRVFVVYAVTEDGVDVDACAGFGRNLRLAIADCKTKCQADPRNLNLFWIRANADRENLRLCTRPFGR